MSILRRSRRLAPRLAALLLAALAGLVVTGLPAHADVPVGFSDPDPVNPLHAVLVIAVIPAALIALIFAAVYLPSLLRGEDVTPAGTPPGPDQWLGGPRRGTAELAGPDGDQTKAGGARGTW